MTRHNASLVTILWLFSLISIVTASQAPPADASRAIVEGVVVNGVTGQPIEGLHVAILEGGQPLSEQGIQALIADQRPSIETPQVSKRLPAFTLGGRTLTPERAAHSVLTDARGRFLITGVVAGKHIVALRGDGYMYQLYGQLAESVFIPPIDIHPGRNDLGRVSIRPESEVDGRIIDSMGNPIRGLPVFLLRADPMIDLDGRRQFTAEGSITEDTITDSDGRYSIKKVNAGRYYLAAGSFGRRDGGIMVRRTTGGNTVREPIAAQPALPYTYYPGVADIGLAGRVDVPAGNKLSLGDMVVTVRELRSIRGRVVDRTTGKAPPSVRMTLNGWTPFGRAGSDSRVILPSGKYDSATGVFEYNNLIPGRYRVDAALPTNSNPGQPAGVLLSQVTAGSAFQLLDLVDSDLDNVVLTVPNGGRVTGRVVTVDGSALPAVESILPIPLQLGLRPLHPSQPSPTVTAVSVQDGTFVVDSALEGKYRFSVVPLRDNYYVSDVRINGTRVLNGILEISEGATLELIVTLSRGGEIQGSAVDSKGQPAKQARGFVLPDPLPETIPAYQMIEADNEGRFSVLGVPTGNHKIYVWDGTLPPPSFDREVLFRSRPRALSIRVERGALLTPRVTILDPVVGSR
jgi:hypothetical protein